MMSNGILQYKPTEGPTVSVDVEITTSGYFVGLLDIFSEGANEP